MRGGRLAVAVAVTLAVQGFTGAHAAEDGKLPDWSGQWMRFAVPGLPGQPSHDQTKAWGRGQQAPLTPEYQAVLEESIADQAGSFTSSAACAPVNPCTASVTATITASLPPRMIASFFDRTSRATRVDQDTRSARHAQSRRRHPTQPIALARPVTSTP